MVCLYNTRSAASVVVPRRMLIMRRAQAASFEIATEPSRDRDHLRAEGHLRIGATCAAGYGSRARREPARGTAVDKRTEIWAFG
jgi:hypothetical protein